MKNFSIICIGGGSIRGLCELGALHYYADEGMLENVKTFIGTSIGAAICLLLSIDYTPMDILSYVFKTNNWMNFEITDLLHFKQYAGILDISNFTYHIENLVNRKLCFIPTLKELYERTGKHLIMSTVNASKHQIEYLDYISNPSLSCINAIKMSCSMPIIFKRIEYQGDYYVDGGLLDNFPIEKVNDGQTDILGICIEGINENTGFFDYIYNLYTLPILEIQKRKIKHLTPNCLVVDILTKNTPSIDFNLSKEKKMNLFCQGYDRAKTVAIQNFISDWEWGDD